MPESERTPLGLAVSLPFTRTFVISFHLHGIPGKEGGRQILLTLTKREASWGQEKLSDLSKARYAVAELGFEF